MSELGKIQSPEDLQALDAEQLNGLCQEIRDHLVTSVSKTGGHLGPNLGVVEITVALHRVFDSPNDSIIFDTGHQSYVHKLLTGRKDLSTLRQKDGMAGYPQRSESVHDIVESSHASSSLSWADGISRAYKATGQLDRHVVAVIGDGALTGGMSWEALNNITDDNDRNLVIVVNDNGRSYAPTMGGMARRFEAIRSKSAYKAGYLVFRKIPVGLDKFADSFPDRVFDVGIAEQHAVAAAAGMAFGGLHPVVAIYSTFISRAFDQVLMDVALHKAGVTFVLDRSGITGPDGASHHGVWDLPLLQMVPGIHISAPRDQKTLEALLRESIEIDDAPSVIRFPKGKVAAAIEALATTDNGVDILKQSPSKDVLIIGVGSFAATAIEVAELLASQGIGATVVDPRWILPVNVDLIAMARDHRLVVTIEDGLKTGGFGSRVRQELRAHEVDTALSEVGVPAEFLEHAERNEILERLGLTAKAISRDIVAQVLGSKVPHAKTMEASQSQDQLTQDPLL